MCGCNFANCKMHLFLSMGIQSLSLKLFKSIKQTAMFASFAFASNKHEFLTFIGRKKRFKNCIYNL